MIIFIVFLAHLSHKEFNKFFVVDLNMSCLDVDGCTSILVENKMHITGNQVDTNTHSCQFRTFDFFRNLVVEIDCMRLAFCRTYTYRAFV